MSKKRLEKLCRGLPGATEEILWENTRVFKVGGKMFYAGNAEDDGGHYSFKVDNDRFLELTDLPGIRPAPYLARAKWVQIDPASCKLPDVELALLVENSYGLVFAKLTKKLQQSILNS